jgi:hypothetical protein
MINISFIKLKGKVTDAYHLTLKGWRSKAVTWEDIHKPMSSSKIQYSCYAWDKGIKSSKNFDRSNQNCIIIDIDDGMSIVDFQSLFSKYKYIIATTKSHQLEKKGIVSDRFRVLIPAINIPREHDVYFRMLELMFPFNDEQTLTKTASFLGTSDCIVLKNEGKLLDCFKAKELAKKQLESEYVEKIVIDKDLINSYGSSSLEDIKKQLTTEMIQDVLESIGIEFVNGKCKLRPEENTSSAKIYESGYICDYGSKEISGDIFHVLMELEGMTFRESLKYVQQFI